MKKRFNKRDHIVKALTHIETAYMMEGEMEKEAVLRDVKMDLEQLLQYNA